MIDLKQTGPPVLYGTFGQKHDYLGTPKRCNNNSPGFQPGVETKTKSVLAGFLPEESKNRDKTYNI